MKATHERIIPGIGSNAEIELEHFHRYHSVAPLARGMRVLDAACGVGYGSGIIAELANSVVGIDLDEESISWAREHYGGANIEFKQMSVGKLEFEDSSFDMVVSFETIEHIDEDMQERFLAEIKRVLKKDGILVMSTPDTEIMMEKSFGKYKNEFHIKEFTKEEYELFLERHFKNVKMYIQDAVACSLILGGGEELRAISDYKNFYGDLLVAVCSDGTIENTNLNGIYVSETKRELVENTDMRCEVFYDVGNGYREEDKLIVYHERSSEGRLRTRFDFDGIGEIRALRLDPVGVPCSLEFTEVRSNIEGISLIPLNRTFSEGNKDIFVHNDPIYSISGEDIGKIGFLEIEYLCKIISAGEIADLWSLQNEKVAEKDRITAEKDRIIAERDRTIAKKEDALRENDRSILHLTEERDAARKMYAEIIDSASWRFTEPIRKALGLLKRIYKK